MFDDILVPTDGSDCSDVASAYAEDLAKHYDATVHTLSVADTRILETGPHSDRVRERCAEIVETVGDDLSRADVSVEQVVRTDLPHQAILRYAADEGIDLVVMGSHGRSGVDRYILGSTTEKVVRLSDVPVLTVRTAHEDDARYPYTDVLVPTDGSAAAAAAIGPGVDIASTYDARLHALSVVDTVSLGIDVRSEAIAETLEETARSAVADVQAEATRAAVRSIETTVEYGYPYRGIRSYVEEHAIDLVVMGTHGRSGVERYLLGSVAEKLLRTSPAPVLTVRQPATVD